MSTKASRQRVAGVSDEAPTKNALSIGREADAARLTLGAIVQAKDTLPPRRD